MSLARIELPSVDAVAQILASAPRQQPWFFEAEVRTAIRVMLVLAGRPWDRADLRAAIAVERARKVAGVPDPVPLGWEDAAETEFWCQWCSAPFSVSRHDRHGHGKLFCCAACKVAADLQRRKERRIASRTPRCCPTCGASIPPETNARRKFCNNCSDTLLYPRTRDAKQAAA